MRIKHILLFILIAIITIGCGGGGGSSNYTPTVKYNGKTTQAKLTETNKKDYLDLINNSFSSFALNLTNSEISMTKKPNYKNSNKKNLKVIDSDTQYGSKSGSLDIVVDKKSDTKLEITYTFNKYDNDENIYLDGQLVIIAELNTKGEETDKLIFKNLNIKTSLGDNIIDGVITIYNYKDATSKIVENYIVKNNKNSDTYKYDNFTSYKNRSGWTTKYSGKLYHSKYGYVDVKTLKELKYNDYGELLPYGELEINGRESVEYIKFAYEGRVRVELDANKDKEIDSIKIYQLDKTKGLIEVENKKPVINISFPKAIYTDSDISTTKIDTYDPDLDKITLSYKWSINSKVVSDNKTISNTLFKKHDNITLCITAKDLNNSTTKCESQEVLNSYPKIEANFKDINLTVGENITIDSYTITDADNDPIVISWRHYRSNKNSLYSLKANSKYVDYTSCNDIIMEYELKNSINFNSLNYEDQEKFKYNNCNLEPSGELVNINFVSDNIFTALDDGIFTHEMIVSDTEVNRTKLLFSNIFKMDLIEKVVKPNSTENSNYNGYNMYMIDTNNDGNKELIYASASGEYTENIKLTVEFRDKETILNKNEYNLTDSNDKDFINYYLGDFNSDGFIDILSIYDSYVDGYIYKIYYQNKESSFENNLTLEESAFNKILVTDIIGNSDDDIIISTSDDIEDKKYLKIISKDKNITFETKTDNLKILANDIDNNLKQDIVLVKVDRNYLNHILDLNITILAQDENEEFSKQYLYCNLGDTSENYDYLIDLKIVDIDNNKYFLVLTDNFFFILKLDNDKLILMQKHKIANYLVNYAKIEDLVDLNGDGKQDIVIADTGSMEPSVRVFIQQDNFNFYEEQQYRLEEFFKDIFISSYAFGDIDNDGKIEIFFNNNTDTLGAIYFK